ncbi:MarR family transcriptional regulator [Solihabitans fulvus]|uniref:MarR family transcriptional regulator n=1 Tax=Solihabitans fulvus TaxID=1892852 RepID=A0A5B2XDT2_9PSEU|nr:MarR family transcriptional regulator [Solihabitans fulvus]KAA2261314.1 MarR family transcriptional regulator [Solihabitans fulvus]
MNAPAETPPDSGIAWHCAKHEDLNWLLHRAGQKLAAALQEESAKAGLDIRGALVLRALAPDLHGVQRTQLALGAAIGLDKTTLTTVLDRLEKQGLLTRKPDPSDRRVRIPEITDEGRAVEARVTAAHREVEARLAGDLSDQERATIYTLLRRFIGTGAPEHGSCV